MTTKSFFLLSAFALINLILWAQPIPANTGSKLTKTDAQIALDFHNKVRADVGSKPLQWSVELAKFAKAWADHLASEGCDMQHRTDDGLWAQKYGENIFWGMGMDYTALDASKSWYMRLRTTNMLCWMNQTGIILGITPKWYGKIQPTWVLQLPNVAMVELLLLQITIPQEIIWERVHIEKCKSQLAFYNY